MTHPSELSEDQLMAACEVRRQRRSGPGGQHRNKVETAIVLTHRPTGVRGEAAERRSQQENRRMALRRLRVNLALRVRSDRDAAEGPSARWSARVGGSTFRVSVDHDDFAPLLAEALDVIAARDDDVAAAARQLGITTSQLIRFLKQEPRALMQVNEQRRARDLRPLR